MNGSPACDVAIVGAGLLGLAAAVESAAAGLETLVLERDEIGGSVCTRAHIELAAGLRIGVSGAELIERAVTQATRFGARFETRADVAGLELEDGAVLLRMRDGRSVRAGATLLCVGADVVLPPIPGIAELVGAGVYTSAPAELPPRVLDRDVFLTGVPTRVADAALTLAARCRSATIVTPKQRFGARIDPLLRDTLRDQRNVFVRTGSAIVAVAGVDRLESLIVRSVRTGRHAAREAAALFVLPHARPRTGWLPVSLARTACGHVITGPAAAAAPWPLQRRPAPFETTMPGVFAAGAVRAGAAPGAAAFAEAGAVVRVMEDRLRMRTSSPGSHLVQMR